MKYWYTLVACLPFTLVLLQQANAQTINPNCFDPSHPDYGSTLCVIQRIEGDDGAGNLFNCNDGVDNNGNGLTDCEEPSCNCTPPPQPATETDCGDGVDNDGDGLIDCQDRDDCGSSVLCENDCGDGVDNDGDGFFDYYDGDCLSDPDNPNNYIVLQPDCEAVPVGNVFSIQAADSSANRTSAAMGMPMVADVDNDGTPEVITTNGQNGMIYVLDGSDLSTIENQRDFGPETRGYPAVADVDDDGFGEIFIVSNDNQIKAYQHDLSNYWTATSTGFTSGRIINVADFNLDGTPEIYQVNEIRDATTGNVLVQGSHGTATYPSANDWQTELNPAPVAVDMFPDGFCTDCQGLELVVGHIVYSVDIAGGQLNEVANMNNAGTLPADYRAGGYHPKDANFTNQSWSTTSVVDFNNDGFLDVIMGGTTGDEDGPTSVFFWDVQNSVVRMFVVARPGNTITANRGNFRDLSGGGCDNTTELCTWRRGLGTVNIANIDGDPELEITFMSGSSLYALDQNLNVEWENHDQFWESSSGFTGTTIFDFDGDGASEVIYRDEINLYIIDGVSGRIINGFLDGSFCSSQTQGEYPIVADVDGDGETEIILSCGRDRNTYGESPATSGTRTNGHIKVYKAANDNYWVPARRVWNQFSYFNVNINDDLSVPIFAQPHHLSFSQLCNDPSAVDIFSLNKFLNQSPRISYCGNLVFPAAKLDFVGDSTRIIPPECPNQEFQIRLYIENNGDEEVERPIPISFYSDDPQQAYADTDEDPHFAVVEIEIPGGLQPGSFIDTVLTVAGPRGNYTLYTSLNDVGPYDDLGNKIDNSAFYPLTTLNGPVRECDDTPTIVSVNVDPTPFSVQVNKIQDNRNCPGAIATDNNGEAAVRAADGSALPISEYSFTWTNIADGSIVSTSPIATELDSGTYEIVAAYDNGVFTCQGIADTVQIERLEDWPTADTVTIEEVQPVSSCDPGTSDGHLRVLLNGITPDLTNYSIYWFDEESTENDTLAVGNEATNLIPLLYKVVINNLLTGCSETVTYDLTLDIPQVSSLTTTDNTNCLSPNGTITVEVDGDEANYDYMLIQMSPAQDTVFSNDPSFANLSEGIYEVRAYDPTNNCGLYTTGEEAEIFRATTAHTITPTVQQPQTACSFPYTGQLTATTADPSLFTWAWYRGTVTNGPLAEVVSSDFTTPDTLSTNLTNVYTVVATEIATGCSFSEAITLTENVVIPAVDPADVNIIQHQTTCEPNGQVQVSVGGATTGYRFNLQQGSTVIESNFTGVFVGLEAGPYFVTAEDTATSCVSSPSVIFRIDNRITPFGTIAIAQTPQTNCNPTNPNGALSATVGGSTTGFTFKWFVGVDTASAYSPQPAIPSQLIGIPADNYVLSIYNQSTGCDTLIYTSVVDESADYLETIIATKLDDQRFCTPGVFSGSIEANLLPSTSGGVPDTASYTYYWYQGTKNQVRNGSATTIPGQNRSVVTGLNVGWHSVRAVRNDGSDCAALDTAEVFIQDARDFPVAGINVDIISQTSCEANNQNGGLRGDVSGNTTGYTFTWYQLVSGVKVPVTDNNPDAVINGFAVDSIGVGTYILEVENTETGCTGDE
ncbi:MAG: VCBS repeat-containing protein, partial [Tunicatimonas sp.]|uniref:FG-GAP repeat domain-containing protein n=1 Tax=Tunicatimonas sp. TaxID=1940096 RepID=UPI003C750328